MAKQVTKTETHYQYGELSESAKESVRAMFLGEFSWADEAVDSLKALASLYGGRIADWLFQWDNPAGSYAKFDMPRMTYGQAMAIMLCDCGTFAPSTYKGHGECKLTGYCMDEAAIDGARKWLFENPVDNDEEIDLEPMMEAAFDTWMRDCAADYESQGEDENVADMCEANGYWFDEEGNIV